MGNIGVRIKEGKSMDKKMVIGEYKQIALKWKELIIISMFICLGVNLLSTGVVNELTIQTI